MREIRGPENRNWNNEGVGGNSSFDLLVSLYWTKEHHALRLCKGKAILLQIYCQTIGFQEVEASRFLENWHKEVVRLSARYTGHDYPQVNVSGTHSC